MAWTTDDVLYILDHSPRPLAVLMGLPAAVKEAEQLLAARSAHGRPATPTIPAATKPSTPMAKEAKQ